MRCGKRPRALSLASPPESSKPSLDEAFRAFCTLMAFVADTGAPIREESSAHYTAQTWPYGSARSMRAAIASGKVPAVKVGREYRVLRADADRVYAPKLHGHTERREPKSERARIDAQLEAAGIRTRGAA